VTGEAITAGAPDSIGSGDGLLTTAAGDDSTDGIGSEFVVGSTRSSAARGGSVTGEAITAGAPDSLGSGDGLLATGAGDDFTDGIGSEFVVGSTRTSAARGGSVTGEAIAAGAPDSIGSGGGLLATGAGDDSTDGIGSELVVGSTRTSAA